MTAAKAPREFSDTSREKMASRGAAMPDGSYPIPDKDALRRAIQSFGRAKNPAAVKQHIIKRARALGATDLLPDDWKAGKASMAAAHSADAAGVLEDLYELIACEAPESHVNLLKQAAGLVVQFIGQEAGEIGTPDDIEAGAMMNGKARLKTLGELKAEPMEASALDRWLDGKIPRRILMLPFGGPLPGGKAGLDLDGEYFDDATDIYGPYPVLRTSRERLVDWHHDNDPTDRMKGAILGRVVFDEKPEDDGYWSDFWANAGEERRKLVARLERGGVPLYGSTQAVSHAVKKADDGHIDVWPVIRHAITTSPQNVYAVVPPLKALLAAPIPSDVGGVALQAALIGYGERFGKSSEAAGSGSSSPGDGRGKAGRIISRKNEQRLAAAIAEVEAFLAEHRERLAALSQKETHTP